MKAVDIKLDPLINPDGERTIVPVRRFLCGSREHAPHCHSVKGDNVLIRLRNTRPETTALQFTDVSDRLFYRLNDVRTQSKKSRLILDWIRSGVYLLGAFLFSGFLFADRQPVTNEATVKVTPEIKNLINGGLKYLASQQRSWSLHEGKIGHPVAMTGYVLLAFMATGNLPHEGEYSKNVADGMQFLLDSEQPDGLFRNVSGGQYMYNHGIATIALAELYGESNTPSLRPKLERAVEVILKSQAPNGGWRYAPTPQGADISVTVLQVVALRAAQDAGLSIPQDAIGKAVEYVNSCYNKTKGGFSYQPGGEPSFARTAAAIYSLQILGRFDDPNVKTGSEFLINVKDRGYWSYGNYYAAPAQYMIGGETWREWYEKISADLIRTAQHEGDKVFWDKQADPSTVGPVFSTAVFIHVLAMPYHLMPLYQR